MKGGGLAYVAARYGDQGARGNCRKEVRLFLAEDPGPPRHARHDRRRGGTAHPENIRHLMATRTQKKGESYDQATTLYERMDGRACSGPGGPDGGSGLWAKHQVPPGAGGSDGCHPK